MPGSVWCCGGVLLAVAACRADAPSETDWKVSERDGVVVVSRPGRLVLEAVTGRAGSKPYVRRLFTPRGLQLLRDEPPGHEHHHGWMLALGVDDVDFWGERYAEVPGDQRERRRLAAVEGPAGGAYVFLAQELDWLDRREARPRLRERRTLLGFPPPEPGVECLGWVSEFAAGEGRDRVTLWGRPYFGLGMRFVAAMDGNGRFLSSDGDPGEVVRGDERLVRARWCAYEAEVDGAHVTVALFDHPANPRHPARFFTMARPFAYLSATLDLAARPLELEAEGTLLLRYGLCVTDGHADAERIERWYRSWLEREGEFERRLGQGRAEDDEP